MMVMMKVYLLMWAVGSYPSSEEEEERISDCDGDDDEGLPAFVSSATLTLSTVDDETAELYYGDYEDFDASGNDTDYFNLHIPEDIFNAPPRSVNDEDSSARSCSEQREGKKVSGRLDERDGDRHDVECESCRRRERERKGREVLREDCWKEEVRESEAESAPN
ncbi:hypothetical protein Q8A73_012800 [Channa argus]|nr:hypothetical protein Q8A73_012800 [Channa argus]